ncbi:DUF6956 domain-containing protein [Parabacteroides sp.]
MNTEYETIRVVFSETLSNINTKEFEDENENWGVLSLKEWIEGYESTRFTPISDTEVIITSEYNMSFVKAWLDKFIFIKSITIY